MITTQFENAPTEQDRLVQAHRDGVRDAFWLAYDLIREASSLEKATDELAKLTYFAVDWYELAIDHPKPERIKEDIRTSYAYWPLHTHDIQGLKDDLEIVQECHVADLDPHAINPWL